jgi:hypothetical protein
LNNKGALIRATSRRGIPVRYDVQLARHAAGPSGVVIVSRSGCVISGANLAPCHNRGILTRGVTHASLGRASASKIVQPREDVGMSGPPILPAGSEIPRIAALHQIGQAAVPSNARSPSRHLPDGNINDLIFLSS